MLRTGTHLETSTSHIFFSNFYSHCFLFSAGADSNFEENVNGVEDDPFDTAFAENILPGKAELKIIENEILNSENDLDFNPRAEEKISEIINKVSIQVTGPAGQRESISSLDRISGNFIIVIH